MLHVADRQVPVRMHRVEDQRQRLLENRPVGDVVHALTSLLCDDVDLVGEVLLGQDVVEVGHPIGLQPQREVQHPRRHRLEVVGAVERRRGVEGGTVGLQQPEVVPWSDVARTLEHQVLEEVRETLAVRLFVTRADVVPEVHCDDTQPGGGTGHHAEPVVEDAGGHGVSDVSGHADECTCPLSGGRSFGSECRHPPRAAAARGDFCAIRPRPAPDDPTGTTPATTPTSSAASSTTD